MNSMTKNLKGRKKIVERVGFILQSGLTQFVTIGLRVKIFGYAYDPLIQSGILTLSIDSTT